MGLKTTQIALECPPYGAKFVNHDTIITAGGGGEGKNGVPNKLTVLKLNPLKKQKISVFTEFSLKDDEDCPMSLDVQNGTILTGVNINSKSDKAVPNTHLRKFQIDEKSNKIEFVDSVDVHQGSDHLIYQKLTALSEDGTQAAIVMSDLKSSLYIINSTANLSKSVPVNTSGEVKDIAISPDGTVLCYITKKDLHIVSMGTGKDITSKALGFTLSKVEFYNDNTLVVSGSSKQNTVIVSKFSIPKSAVVQQVVADKASKGVTSIDVNKNNSIISLACSDCSIVLIRYSDLALIKKVKNVHKFAITKVTSNEEGSFLVSVSADSTINVIEIPQNYATTKSLPPLLVLISIIFIALLSVGLQYAHNKGHIKTLQEKSVEFYNSNIGPDNSSSVSEYIAESETAISSTTYLSTESELAHVTDAVEGSWTDTVKEVPEKPIDSTFEASSELENKAGSSATESESQV